MWKATVVLMNCKNLLNNFYLRLAMLVWTLAISSCFPIANLDTKDPKKSLRDKIDPQLGLSREDYRKKLMPPSYNKEELEKKEKDKNAPKESSQKDEVEPQIPEYSDILSAPPPPLTNQDKLVSLAVNEDVPIKDVLVELSRIADVDMEIDPAITGGIIFRVKDKPFKQVIERISDLAGLRYREKNGILRVEKDTPFLVNYKVDFLNMIRSASSNILINTNVLTSGTKSNNSTSPTANNNSNSFRNNNTQNTGNNNNSSSSGNGNGLSSGSNNSLTSSYDGNLWSSIETTLQAILAFKPSNMSVENETATSVAPVATAAGQTPSYNINKQAGIISVLATEKQHKNVKDYLDNIKKTVSAQVLIEAKIVEVTLDEQYKSGIDWGKITDVNSKLALQGDFGKSAIDTTGNYISFGHMSTSKNLTSSISLTEQFGVSRTLSSPRLNAMNNQQAVLTFAQNAVYFTLQAEEQKDNNSLTGNTQLTVNSTVNSVPIGMILALQPSINLDTQEITMNIRPTLSRISSTVRDPGVDILVARNVTTNGGQIKSEIPVVEVRELDSILKIRSGEIMVIGGLMKELNSNTDTGVPGVSRVPVFGNLFKGVNKQNQVVETVIFIKATIVPSDPNTSTTKLIEQGDQDIYKTFTRDPRPLVF